MAKYLRKFGDLDAANTAGSNGLYSPHVDIITEVDSVNMLKVAGETFKCSFNNTGKLIVMYTVELTAGDGGTVSGAGTYNNGTVVTITATPNTGYKFSQWSDGITASTRQITVNSNITLSASFAVQTYKVTLTAGSGGTVSGAGTYNYGAVVTIIATPSDGYKFTQWSDGNTNATRSITVNSDITLSASFIVQIYTVTLTANSGGTVSGGGTYNYGTVVTITATPNTGYKFSSWSDGNINASRSITVNSDITLSASFETEVATKTWYFNDSITYTIATYACNFISNNINYTSIKVARGGRGTINLFYDSKLVFYTQSGGGNIWVDEIYRTIILDEPATGDLLTFLTENATKVS